MSIILACILAAFAVTPDNGGLGESIWTPHEVIPETGDVMAVGDVEYVMIRKADWFALTNKVAALSAVADRRWENDHKTEQGRKLWHGNIIKVESDSVALEKRTIYADGYTWTEKMVKKAQNPPPTRSADSAGKTIPPKLKAKREAVLTRKTRTVNAVFSAGGKVEEVKE